MNLIAGSLLLLLFAVMLAGSITFVFSEYPDIRFGGICLTLLLLTLAAVVVGV